MTTDQLIYQCRDAANARGCCMFLVSSAKGFQLMPAYEFRPATNKGSKRPLIVQVAWPRGWRYSGRHYHENDRS